MLTCRLTTADAKNEKFMTFEGLDDADHDDHDDGDGKDDENKH